MYNALSLVTAGIQAVFFIVMVPFIIRQIKKEVKTRNLCAIMNKRCYDLVEQLRIPAKNWKMYDISDLQLDVQAINCWLENNETQLKVYTAFVDKWEAKIADGEITEFSEN